ncbi:hypothetical protein PF010_g7326 [Phytophthora fragariae]|uniref:Molybdate-anion transporter n=1 Tax=Phytophthora fragariae TaxID=53985 RepID=A0A6G0LIN4_9STRA|nr:hypothetical protein PF010_g7326 [Phytophthora fragariae]KAE9243756.1 hypothetical protein PF004_g5993 [Phytophthora fragariae]
MLLTTWLSDAFQWPVWASACCDGLLVFLLTLHAVEKLFVVQNTGQKIAKEQAKASDDKAFAHFQRQYLVVYGLVMFADWLQGTHMYSLYQSYGVNVGTLFLTGFLSSVVFGNFVGPLVDKYGRRKACLLYCALEVAINIVENIPIMEVLLLGRVLGGISTSLFFSAFESWMVTEHRARGFSESLLEKTFALGSEINGVVAVLAGLVAQVAADEFGDIGPFRAAIVVTAIAAAFVLPWSENYGSLPQAAGKDAQKKSASENNKSSSSLCAGAYALGFCYSLFEGAMYVFVFLWYPTLESVVPDGVVPSGLVFSSFMLCIAIGGKLFDLIENYWLREELLLVLTTAASAISLLSSTITDDYQYILAGFLVFEVCVGVISPCCATLRSRNWRWQLFEQRPAILRMQRCPCHSCGLRCKTGSGLVYPINFTKKAQGAMSMTLLSVVTWSGCARCRSNNKSSLSLHLFLVFASLAP